MAEARETAVVIAPGRGTYTAAELGYLGRWHRDKGALLDALEAFRADRGRESLAALDSAARYSLSRHGIGSNAAGLIYGSALGDWLDIDRDRFDVVAVTGNSMGWYLALAAAGSAPITDAGIALTETMAELMDAHGSGGQIVYPLVDADWKPSDAHAAAVARVLESIADLHVSIRLGGSVVLAGSDAAIAAAMGELPAVDGRYPLRLAHHAAFHTPLLEPVSRIARETLAADLLGAPEIPLIDGRGAIWQPWSDVAALTAYTLATQVTRTFDFTRAIEVALEEFAPDRLILLGPGTTLGAPVLQVLLSRHWFGLDSRSRWQERQAADPFLLAFGVEAQRKIATGDAR